MRFYGLDLVDFYRGRLTFRKLLALIRHLPPESAVAVAEGGHGFSMLELLVMESGVYGELNPRHPWRSAEDAKASARIQALRGRQAYYEARRLAQQSTAEGGDGEADQSDEQHQATHEDTER